MMDRLDRLYKSVALVMGELCTALVKRRVSRSRLPVWSSRFRAAADEMDAIARDL